MKTDNVIADIISGIVALFLGINFTWRREKIINALIASNKIFWEKMGFSPDQKKGVFLTSFIIPLMGVLFLLAGIVLFYRAINYFMK